MIFTLFAVFAAFSCCRPRNNGIGTVRRVYDGIGRTPYSAVILPARIAAFSVFFRSGLVKISD